jgi:hypothetical protein
VRRVGRWLATVGRRIRFVVKGTTPGGYDWTADMKRLCDALRTIERRAARAGRFAEAQEARNAWSGHDRPFYPLERW